MRNVLFISYQPNFYSNYLPLTSLIYFILFLAQLFMHISVGWCPLSVVCTLSQSPVLLAPWRQSCLKSYLWPIEPTPLYLLKEVNSQAEHCFERHSPWVLRRCQPEHSRTNRVVLLGPDFKWAPAWSSAAVSAGLLSAGFLTVSTFLKRSVVVDDMNTS